MIAHGHNAEAVWNLTPRQIDGYTQLALRRTIAERASSLAITAIGAQGNGDTIKKQLEDWEKES